MKTLRYLIVKWYSIKEMIKIILNYSVGDIVSLKKGHPCGENKWEILRTGADIKIKCLGCDRQIWLTRIEFEKRVRKILIEDKWLSIVNYKGNENEIDVK